MGSSLSPTFAPTLDGYTVVNANVAYQWDNYTVAVFATNLLDEDYYDSYLDKSLLAPSASRRRRSRPRHHG